MTLFSAGLSGLAVAATVFLAASTATTPGRWIAPLRSTSTGNAYVQGDVTPISPKISGYITAVAIRDNQAVKAGDVLFTIDDSDYRARVDQAAAGVATRRAMLDNLASRLAQQRAVIEQAVAALRGAEAEAHRAALDLARFRELTARSFVSQARLDQAEAEHLRNSASVAQAQANVAAARGQINVLESQRPELRADIDAALAALRLAQIELENTVVRAPSTAGSGSGRRGSDSTCGRALSWSRSWRRSSGWSPTSRRRRLRQCRSATRSTFRWTASLGARSEAVSRAFRRRAARSSRCCRPTTPPATSRASCSAFRSRSPSIRVSPA